MTRIYEELWYFWHCSARAWFDSLGTEYWRLEKSRPWWHLCCNGNHFGWRTSLCDILDYRRHK